MESGIATLTKSADELAEQAEGSSKPMEFITQFNAVRRSVKEKQNEVVSLDSKLQSKLKDLETTPIQLNTAVLYLSNQYNILCSNCYCISCLNVRF